MLLAIAQWLSQDARVFNVFGYITLRAVLASLTALAISLLATAAPARAAARIEPAVALRLAD